jgi:hypothetical protein
MNRQDIHYYQHTTRFNEINHQMLIKNGLKGILTIVGVLTGCWVVGVIEPRVVVIIGLTTCAAMGLSGVWCTYRTLSAKRQRTVQSLEQAMLAPMADTKQARAWRFSVIVASTLGGLDRLLMGSIILSPLALDHIFVNVVYAYATSLALSLICLLNVMILMVASPTSRESLV